MHTRTSCHPGFPTSFPTSSPSGIWPLVVDYVSKFPEYVQLMSKSADCMIQYLQDIFSETLVADHNPFSSIAMRQFATDWEFESLQPTTKARSPESISWPAYAANRAANTTYTPESFSLLSKHEHLYRSRPTHGMLGKIPSTYSRPLVAAILKFNMVAILDLYSAITPKLRQVETLCLLLNPVLRVKEPYRTIRCRYDGRHIGLRDGRDGLG